LTHLHSLLVQFGPWAVFALVALESAGIPLPGETILITAAVLAGRTHEGSIVEIIACAAAGAIVGDNIGFWVGREFGLGLLIRHGESIGLDEDKLKLGQYLFQRFGGPIVFFGRFVAVLRAFAAVLAGANNLAPGVSSCSTRREASSGRRFLALAAIFSAPISTRSPVRSACRRWPWRSA